MKNIFAGMLLVLLAGALASCSYYPRNNPTDPYVGNTNFAIHFHGIGVISNANNITSLAVHDDSAIFTVGVSPFNVVKYTFSAHTTNDVLLAGSAIGLLQNPRISVNVAANKVVIISNDYFFSSDTNFASGSVTPAGSPLAEINIDNLGRIATMDFGAIRQVSTPVWGPFSYMGNAVGIGVGLSGSFYLVYSTMSGGSNGSPTQILVVEKRDRNTGSFVSGTQLPLNFGTESVSVLSGMNVYGDDLYIGTPNSSHPLIRVKNGTGTPEFVHLFPEVKERVIAFGISGTGKLVLAVEGRLLIYKASGK
ncbi:MAG: hypothetical protein JNM63_08620 [Spirochaetia bacterium]|nr:hypothetical protein [Spirochaetia bacterium]